MEAVRQCGASGVENMLHEMCARCGRSDQEVFPRMIVRDDADMLLGKGVTDVFGTTKITVVYSYCRACLVIIENRN